MKKWIRLFSVVVCFMLSLNLFLFAAPAYAATGVLREDTFDSRTPGVQLKGGGFIASNSSALFVAGEHPSNHTIAGLLTNNGEAHQFDCNVSPGISNGFLGDSVFTVDIYRESAECSLKITSRTLVNTKAAADYSGPVYAEFKEDQTLWLADQEVGTYELNTDYRLQWKFLASEHRYVVSVLSGKLNGIQISEPVSKEASIDEKIVGTGLVRFAQTAAPPSNTAADWVDNISIAAADNVWQSPQITNGKTAANITGLSFVTPRYLNIQNLTGISLTKTGEAASATAAVETYGRTFDIDGQDDINNYFKADPAVTFSEPLTAGEYTLTFEGASDTAGDPLQAICFTVQNEEDSCNIESVEGCVVDGNQITGVVKGTTAAELFEKATISDGASLAILKNGTEAENPSDVFLFGGEQIKVTSASGSASKIYTLVAQDDIFTYDFNQAKLLEELEPSQILNAANRTGNIGSLIRQTFPDSSFENYRLNEPESGTKQIVGDTDPLKAITDRTGAYSLIEYTGSGSGEFTADLEQGISFEKDYAVNVNIRPMAEEAMVLQLYAGNRNASYKNSIAEVTFDGSKQQITSGEETVSDSVKDCWYTVSFHVSYEPLEEDAGNGIFTVQTFVNGEKGATCTKETSAMDGTTWQSGIAFKIKQTDNASLDTRTSAGRFDNISEYEVADLAAGIVPNGYDFVPELQAELCGKFDNKGASLEIAPVTAAALKEGIANLPAGWTAEVYSADEQSAVSDNVNLTSGMKLVLKYGEIVRSYDIRSAEINREAGKVSLTLPGCMDRGTFILAVYSDGRLINCQTGIISADEESRTLSCVLAEDGGTSTYTVKGYVFENMVSLKPLLGAIVVQ